MIAVEQKTRPATCGRHGAYESVNPLGNIWLGCPKCEDETEAAKAAVSARTKAGQEASYTRARIAASGVPERFRDRTLERYLPVNDQARAYHAIAVDFARNFGVSATMGRNLLFLGTVGTGKTHLAAGIALHLATEGKFRPLYTTAQRAIRRVKDTWDRGATESEAAAIAALAEPDLLVLDEVGVQFGSEAERNILFDVLNERYERRRSTIIASNLLLDAVTVFLGERIIDRLREDGAKVCSFTWESYR